MATDTRYNGWSNYETWNCALWFDNDYGLYSLWHERAQELYDDADEEDRDDLVGDLAKELESWVEENTPEVSGMFADLLNSALGAIDYYEIAEHYMSDVEKREADPTTDDTLEA
jgi:hypothetical protein